MRRHFLRNKLYSLVSDLLGSIDEEKQAQRDLLDSFHSAIETTHSVKAEAEHDLGIKIDEYIFKTAPSESTDLRETPNTDFPFELTVEDLKKHSLGNDQVLINHSTNRRSISAEENRNESATHRQLNGDVFHRRDRRKSEVSLLERIQESRRSSIALSSVKSIAAKTAKTDKISDKNSFISELLNNQETGCSSSVKHTVSINNALAIRNNTSREITDTTKLNVTNRRNILNSGNSLLDNKTIVSTQPYARNETEDSSATLQHIPATATCVDTVHSSQVTPANVVVGCLLLDARDLKLNERVVEIKTNRNRKLSTIRRPRSRLDYDKGLTVNGQIKTMNPKAVDDFFDNSKDDQPSRSQHRYMSHSVPATEQDKLYAFLQTEENVDIDKTVIDRAKLNSLMKSADEEDKTNDSKTVNRARRKDVKAHSENINNGRAENSTKTEQEFSESHTKNRRPLDKSMNQAIFIPVESSTGESDSTENEGHDVSIGCGSTIDHSFVLNGNNKEHDEDKIQHMNKVNGINIKQEQRKKVEYIVVKKSTASLKPGLDPIAETSQESFRTLSRSTGPDSNSVIEIESKDRLKTMKDLERQNTSPYHESNKRIKDKQETHVNKNVHKCYSAGARRYNVSSPVREKENKHENRQSSSGRRSKTPSKSRKLLSIDLLNFYETNVALQTISKRPKKKANKSSISTENSETTTSSGYKKHPHSSKKRKRFVGRKYDMTPLPPKTKSAPLPNLNHVFEQQISNMDISSRSSRSTSSEETVESFRLLKSQYTENRYRRPDEYLWTKLEIEEGFHRFVLGRTPPSALLLRSTHECFITYA